MACRKARRSWLDDFWSNMPAWMTFWSTLSLYLAAARIFSSTLLTVHRRSTRTSFCWPMRWARSCAWRSWNRRREEKWDLCTLEKKNKSYPSDKKNDNTGRYKRKIRLIWKKKQNTWGNLSTLSTSSFKDLLYLVISADSKQSIQEPANNRNCLEKNSEANYSLLISFSARLSSSLRNRKSNLSSSTPVFKPCFRQLRQLINIGCADGNTWCGFQSLSKMTTVSAACRLRPRPPALVLSRKMKYWDPSSLNFFNSDARSSDLVVPETLHRIKGAKTFILTFTGYIFCCPVVCKMSLGV